MRISDWSSDVCSSDLLRDDPHPARASALADERRCATRLHSRARRSAEPARRMARPGGQRALGQRSEEHTSELQSLMRISYAVCCLKKTTIQVPVVILPQ